MAKKLHKVFAYGILRPVTEDGYVVLPTHRLPGYLMRSYYGSYPYLKQRKDGVALGNVVEVNDEELAQFDHIEGVNRGMYKRIKANCYNMETTEKVRVHVYVEAGLIREDEQHGKIVTGGDWYAYRFSNAYAPSNVSNPAN